MKEGVYRLMEKLRWQQAYSVGIPAMDDEHKMLIAIINDLHDAFLNGSGTSKTLEIMNRLIEYIKVHFRHEEALLEKIQYPKLDIQRQQHRKLSEEVVAKYRRIGGPQAPSAYELSAFLRTWLIDHIMTHDMLYGGYALAHGTPQKVKAE